MVYLGKFLAVVAEEGVKIIDCENGTSLRDIQFKHCTLIKWLPDRQWNSMLVIFSNRTGLLDIFLEARCKIYSGNIPSLHGEVIDIVLIEDSSLLITLQKASSSWSISSFETGWSEKHTDSRIVLEEKLSKTQELRDCCSNMITSLDNFHAEHLKVIRDLEASSPHDGLQGLMEEVILMDNKQAASKFKALYDVRKAYRTRDTLMGLLETLKRNLSMLVGTSVNSATIEGLKCLISELADAQKLFISWIISRKCAGVFSC